jgi:hypothetical protein
MLAYQIQHMKNFFLTLFFAFSAFLSIAQLAINDWRVHFPTTGAIAVSYGNNKVYCATEAFVYVYSLEDNGIERLSKNNLLSSTGISAMTFDQPNNTLIVGYSDGNLDFIKDGSTFNDRSIKNSSIGGSKNINQIKSSNEFVYLSTAFGIVVYDIQKREVKDSYIIGPGGANLQVWSTIVFENQLLAATDIGLFSANSNNPFLADFNSWSRIETIQNSENGVYQLVSFNNKIFIAQSIAGEADAVFYSEDLVTWTLFRTGGFFEKLDVSNNKLIICFVSLLQVIEPDLSISVEWYNLGEKVIYPKDAVVLPSFQVVLAESDFGLVKLIPWLGQYETISPNAPASNFAFALFYEDNRLVKTSGGPTGNWVRQFNSNGFDVLHEGSWKSYKFDNSNLEGARDISGFAIDPNDENHWFVGTWGDGLLEMRDGVIVNQFIESNSPLQGSPETTGPGVLSVKFDDDNNLWMSNGYANTPVAVLTKEGNFVAHETSSIGGPGSNLLGRFLINQSGHMWFIRERGGGILVYDANGTPEDHTDDRAKTINANAGSGNLPTNDVLSIAEDLNGEIWVGTQEGICVFYAPASVFSTGNFDAQRILLEQDGNIQILLETEAVLSIAVDGANRKWLGTQSSGVFLMSPDGTQQIQHFTVDNSPLPSNVVQSIAIDGQSGEVFFGTEMGLVSFRGTATDGIASNRCYKVFPNPVRESYDGPIAITGLARNTNVKITDLVGNLVFETTSEGGQAIWDGRNTKGERVSTGVYLALCTAPEGTSKCVSKILVAR